MVGANVVRAVLGGAFLCIVTAFILIGRRKHKQEGPPRGPSRPIYQMGPLHPEHPDRPGVALSDRHRSKWDAIEAELLEDTGLAISDSEDGAS